MTPEEFRSAGHQLIDWIADSRASVEDRPVLAQVKPGEISGNFEDTPPTGTVAFESLLSELNDTTN